MSSQTTRQSREVGAVLVGLTVASFANVCARGNWVALAAFLGVLVLVGLFVWLDPFNRSPVSRDEFKELAAEVKQLRENATALRMKLGLQAR